MTPWTAACQASLSLTISWSLLKIMSVEPEMPSNYLILWYPLLLLPSIFPSIKAFSKESTLHTRWPKYWSFNSSSVLPINIQGWFPLGLTGLISLLSRGLSRVFCSTTIWKHLFFGTQPSLSSNSQFSSVAQSCLTLCNPMNHSMPGLPVHHQLPDFTQTHVHWVHPTISSSVIPFSSCPQSFPASGSFQMSQLFAWGGQSIGVSASTSVLPMNTQDWFPLGWTGWISLQSKGLSRVLSNTIVQKHQFFCAQLSL